MTSAFVEKISKSKYQALPPGLTLESVRAQVEKILASPRFVRSDRSNRMLRFLVEKTLLGEADEIKEYVLGVEVLGRGDSFDPQLDPIARVEAGRLRKKLDEYYQAEGQNDPIVIELPKGRHVPVFRARQPRDGKVRLTWRWMRSFRGWPKPAIAGVVCVLLLLMLFGRGFSSGAKLSVSKVGAANNQTRSSSAGPGPRPEATIPSIAVLPFSDLSPAKDGGDFSRVLTEELTATLDGMPGLQVAPRTASSNFKGNSPDIRAVGKQLDVRMALVGGVLRADRRVQITAQLMNATDGSHIWSQTYDGEVKDVASFEQGLANAVTETLGVEMSRSDGGRHFDAYSPRREVHDLYLMGLYHARKWAEPELQDGIERFAETVDLDPGYAPGYAGLAECYALLGTQALAPPSEVMPKAKAAAAKALALDSTLGDAHLALGTVKGAYEWDWTGARDEFSHAFAIRPDDADAHVAYVSAYLLPRGELGEAQSEIERAQHLDPLSPRVYLVSGRIQYYQRHYDEAIAQYRKALELDSRFSPAHLALASAYAAKFMYGDALAEVEEVKAAVAGDRELLLLGHTYAQMGKRAQAQAILERLEAIAKQRYVSAVHISELYADLGEKGEELAWLEKASQQRSLGFACLKLNPHFDGVRSDPRFIALLRRVGLQ